MTTKVLNVFANLETEFLEAKKSLKDVDENIKKITGREPMYYSIIILYLFYILIFTNYLIDQ